MIAARSFPLLSAFAAPIPILSSPVLAVSQVSTTSIVEGLFLPNRGPWDMPSPIQLPSFVLALERLLLSLPFDAVVLVTEIPLQMGSSSELGC
jgi:hypothetical protein